MLAGFCFCASARSEVPELVLRGQWPGYRRGPAIAVAVSGSHAYIASDDAGMQVIDLNDPTRPLRVGGYDTADEAWGIAVAGTHAFVADGDAGLQILDIAEPANPRWIASVATPGNAWGVTVSGSLAYVAAGPQGLQIVDVSNPVLPRIVGSIATAGDAYAVAVAGQFAFVAGGEWDFNRTCRDGLTIVDVSDPANPVRVAGHDTTGEGSGVAVAGNHAFLSDRMAGLWVLDIHDPHDPSVAGQFTDAAGALAVAILDSAALVASEGGLHVVDIHDPSNPQPIALVPGYFAYGIGLSGRRACIAALNTLEVVDLTEPALPQTLGRYDASGSSASAAAFAGDLAYLPDSDGGLRVLDLRDPTNPVSAGTYQSTGHIDGIALAGDHALLAISDVGIEIVNLDVPTSPTLVATYPTGSEVQDLAVAGKLAFVATLATFDGAARAWVGGGIQILDISNPADPQWIGWYDTPSEVGPYETGQIAVSGTHGYVAARKNGLLVIDVSEPSLPRRVGGHAASGPAYGVSISGDHAFVAGRSAEPGPSNPALVRDGLQVFEIREPWNPVQVGRCDTRGGATQVAVHGSYAYVALEGRGIEVIDVRDPTRPSPVTVITGLNANDVAASPDLISLSARDQGLFLFAPYSPALHLGEPGMVEAGFQFRIRGGAALSVRVERSIDMVEWSHWLVVSNAVADPVIVDIDARQPTRGFYRAVAP
jgi:hypothetical protein